MVYLPVVAVWGEFGQHASMLKVLGATNDDFSASMYY